MEDFSEQGQFLSSSQVEDLCLAASKMGGVERRSFQAQMTLKYCEGSARLAERVFGWGRVNVEVGLAEQRTGIVCVGAQSGYGGAKRWEEKQPEAAAFLRQLAESHAQQDPTFQTTLAYTRLTAQAALKHLHTQGFSQEQLPAASTMALILNRMGYRLRTVIKAKPQKNCQKQTQFSTTSKPKISLVVRVRSGE